MASRDRLEDLGRIAEISKCSTDDDVLWQLPRWKDLEFPDNIPAHLMEVLQKVWWHREKLEETLSEVHCIARYGDDEPTIL